MFKGENDRLAVVCKETFFFPFLALCSTKEFNILIKNVRKVFSALKAGG